MKEILKEVHQHCQDMQKMAETKNAGLIAFNGAITLATIKLFTDGIQNYYFQYYLFLVLACSLISIFLNLSAISAQLKHKEQEISNHKSQNLLFFGTVANYTPEEYLKQLKTEYNLNDEITKYNIDQARQVVINAQIALRKFKLFNSAFKWTISGIATPLSVVIYLLFFDNNK
ncbi:Pycsar system effector family protein [Amniculibacterium sp. G2-70]|uniref:Pycsar system effector family protein n=1 Tax=Amniculibacterium sp. G2-70 TaxID=2767188 RepID=UPI001654588F|nr:Pycsar system effector family protein [Amniculibacterium sp. G2-70]